MANPTPVTAGQKLKAMLEALIPTWTVIACNPSQVVVKMEEATVSGLPTALVIYLGSDDVPLDVQGGAKQGLITRTHIWHVLLLRPAGDVITDEQFLEAHTRSQLVHGQPQSQMFQGRYRFTISELGIGTSSFGMEVAEFNASMEIKDAEVIDFTW